MSKLVEQYYQSTRVADGKLLSRGQLCWAPGYYLAPNITTVELTSYDPRDERRNRYAILPNPPEDLLFNHTPVHEIGLKYNEELLVIKAKMRLFVIASQKPILWPAGAGRLSERGFVCLPLYSFHSTDPPDIRARVEALEYPWWIYLPENKNLRTKEGFIRLDRVQVIEERLIKPITIALTGDALFFISEWLRYYLTEEIEPIFLEDRKESLKELGIS